MFHNPEATFPEVSFPEASFPEAVFPEDGCNGYLVERTTESALHREDRRPSSITCSFVAHGGVVLSLQGDDVPVSSGLSFFRRERDSGDGLLGRCIVNGLLGLDRGDDVTVRIVDRSMTSPSVLMTSPSVLPTVSSTCTPRGDGTATSRVIAMADVIRAAETRSMTSPSVVSTVVSGSCTHDVRLAWVPHAP
jgi:hypothetical protein